MEKPDRTARRGVCVLSGNHFIEKNLNNRPLRPVVVFCSNKTFLHQSALQP